MTDFNDLTHQQLREAAERFGLEPDGRWSEKTLAAKLMTAGVTIEQIQSSENLMNEIKDAHAPVLNPEESGDSDDSGDSDEDEESVKSETRVVLKMDRHNASFSVTGHKFTKDDPFIVMSEEEALWIMDTYDGFRIAHPTEAAKFYKGAK